MAAEPLHKTLWQGNQALAEECLAHPFVRGLGDGSLDPEVFKHYLAQDAFFLQALFSAYALGAVRAVERREVVQRLHGLMRGVLDELKLSTKATLRVLQSIWGTSDPIRPPALIPISCFGPRGRPRSVRLWRR